MRKIIITFILILLISTVSVSAFRLADYITGNAVRELSANNRRVSYSGCTPNADGSVTATATSRRSGERQVTLRPNRRGTVAYTCNGNSVVRLKGRSGNRRIGFTTAVDEATRRHNQFNNNAADTGNPEDASGGNTPGPVVTGGSDDPVAVGLENAELLHEMTRGDRCVCTGLSKINYDFGTEQSRGLRTNRPTLLTHAEDTSIINQIEQTVRSKSITTVIFHDEDTSIVSITDLKDERVQNGYSIEGKVSCYKEGLNIVPQNYACTKKNDDCQSRCEQLVQTDFTHFLGELGNNVCEPKIIDSMFGLIYEFNPTKVYRIIVQSTAVQVAGKCESP